MSHDFILALYVFCANFHSGQASRGYRIVSRLERGYQPRLNAAAVRAIEGNRHTRRAAKAAPEAWHEWETARRYYRDLKRRYAATV
jgi:hypothetical protein